MSGTPISRKALAIPLSRTGDRVQDDQARRFAHASQAAASGALANCRLVTTDDDGSDGILFDGVNARLVSHGLGRTIIGCFEVSGPNVNESGIIQIYSSPLASVDLTKHIRLNSISTGRCYIMVF